MLATEITAQNLQQNRLDSTFGTGGLVTTDFGNPADVGVFCPAARKDCSEDIARKVAIQTDGKTVVVGGAGLGVPSPLIALARYDAGPIIADSDGDGLPDDQDQCPTTPSGAVVDSNGCSIAQLVPCAGPRSGRTWRNHGHYVSALVNATRAFLAAGIITKEEARHNISVAARSDYGKPVRMRAKHRR